MSKYAGHTVNARRMSMKADGISNQYKDKLKGKSLVLTYSTNDKNYNLILDSAEGTPLGYIWVGKIKDIDTALNVFARTIQLI